MTQEARKGQPDTREARFTIADAARELAAARTAERGRLRKPVVVIVLDGSQDDPLGPSAAGKIAPELSPFAVKVGSSRVARVARAVRLSPTEQMRRDQVLALNRRVLMGGVRVRRYTADGEVEGSVPGDRADKAPPEATKRVKETRETVDVKPKPELSEKEIDTLGKLILQRINNKLVKRPELLRRGFSHFMSTKAEAKMTLRDGGLFEKTLKTGKDGSISYKYDYSVTDGNGSQKVTLHVDAKGVVTSFEATFVEMEGDKPQHEVDTHTAYQKALGIVTSSNP